MTSRSNPFDDIERMFDRLSDQFAEFDPVELGSMGAIAVDVRDEGDAIVVVADLPGYETDDIEVTLNDERTLHLYAERESETEETEEGVYVRRERTQESIERTISLPDAVEDGETSAGYDNGVLTVTLPKQTPDEDSRSIPVE
ncbi:Hsp20/alpha crystallin family protein [Halapricum salinum]|uniref:Hsp20/alpha crystallin family protein n=1 Tax=Halapricum salinum TaxID=1457250 RepID=A0A4D6HCK9_9EURY|nr:Hsp20/alpha crystallin family protein [Halapricum salinum]QCC50792.1 Hsp20/alpha crystallin family protein [Halapricum salinum]